MANTYTQLYVHFVFAVQNRQSLISEDWQPFLYQYLGGIIKNHGNKPYIINGMPDHIHALVSMHPDQSPSDLMYRVKRNSSIWINEKRFVKGKFRWQEGFGAFSYSKSQIPVIAGYIENQKQHHRVKTFREEYVKFLEEFEIDFDERYILKQIE
ncbi:MAG: IS200/IS605 family transposase [Bacteroidales bacterium]|nr:IS200/IS605 family transposase [Bacteroidales bacterium]